MFPMEERSQRQISLSSSVSGVLVSDEVCSFSLQIFSSPFSIQLIIFLWNLKIIGRGKSSLAAFKHNIIILQQKYMSGYFCFTKQKHQPKQKRSTSVGLIFSLPDPVIEVSGTELRHKFPKRSNLHIQKNNSAMQLVNQYEKQLRSTLQESRKDKYISNIVILANKEKMSMMDQYNPITKPSKIQPVPQFSQRKKFFSTRTSDFKSISILNRTIFASQSGRKKQIREPFELAINKLPIAHKKIKLSKINSKQFGFKGKETHKEIQVYEQKDRKEKKRKMQRPQIRGWDTAEEQYF